MSAALERIHDTITDSDVAIFDRDGAVCLRGVFEPQWLNLIAEGLEHALAEPGPYSRKPSPEDDPGQFFTDYYMWRRIPALRRFALESPAGAVAARLLGARQVNFFFDGLFIKEPGTLTHSHWHQDQPSYSVDGWQVVVIWTPIDPVAKESALELVRGSHRWGKWFLPEYFSGDQRNHDPTDSHYAPLPNIDSDRARYEILSWDMQPGDCVAFHAMMLHGSQGNHSKALRRRALSTTWLGDDAVFGSRPFEPDPVIEGHHFEPGERLDVEAVFPQVWPRLARTSPQN